MSDPAIKADVNPSTPTPAPPAPRRPDAVIVPISWGAYANPRDRHKAYHDIIAPVLGATQVYARNQGNEHYITAATGDTLYFPYGHAREKQARYKWEDQEEFAGIRTPGVKFGYLVEGATAGGEANSYAD